MAHIDEGTLQAYLDDEVGVRTEIDAHIQWCATCAAELNRLRRASQLFADACQTVDVQAPQRSVKSLGRRRLLPRMPLARAALFLIGFAAIASAAIPGSPVRAWISYALHSIGVLPDSNQPAARVASEPRASADAAEKSNDAAALSIEPANGRVLVVLTNVSKEAQIRVRVVETERAQVQASGEAAQARFKTGAGRIELIGVGRGEVIVDLPSSVKEARVEADGRVLFEKAN